MAVSSLQKIQQQQQQQQQMATDGNMQVVSPTQILKLSPLQLELKANPNTNLPQRFCHSATIGMEPTMISSLSWEHIFSTGSFESPC